MHVARLTTTTMKNFTTRSRSGEYVRGGWIVVAEDIY
jgi:hypothetical protein